MRSGMLDCAALCILGADWDRRSGTAEDVNVNVIRIFSGDSFSTADTSSAAGVKDARGHLVNGVSGIDRLVEVHW